MGRWDTSIFGNDDAGDWVWELEEEGLEACLERTAQQLKAQSADGFMEMGDCEIAIAAGAVVAMLRGMPRLDNLQPELVQLLDNAEWQPGRGLVRSYIELIDMALSEKGEIVQPGVWGGEDNADDADFREWRGNVLEIKRFLEGEAAHG